MSYYRTKRTVLNSINKIVENAKTTKSELDINGLRLQFLLNYEIGELSINKMLSSLGKYHGFKIKNDVLVWEVKK